MRIEYRRTVQLNLVLFAVLHYLWRVPDLPVLLLPFPGSFGQSEFGSKGLAMVALPWRLIMRCSKENLDGYRHCKILQYQ